MKTLILIAICITTMASAQKYDSWRWNQAGYFSTPEYTKRTDKSFSNWAGYGQTLDIQQFSIWGMFVVAGIAHGTHEAFYADRYLFERRYGADPKGFWGNLGWMRNYHGDDPTQPHKQNAWNWTRDVKHTTYFINKTMIVGGSFAIGARGRQPLKFRAANFLLGVIGQSVAATITYNTLRYPK